MPTRSISPRALTASYCVALALIAGLSLVSHALLELGLRDDQGSAAIINITGRQRMLSQRIAGLAAQYRLGDASARADMVTAIGRFEAAHDALTAATRRARPASGSAALLQALYFGDDAAPDAGRDAVQATLDARVRGFIADARRVAAMPADDPALAPVLGRLFAAARASLLEPLDQVVQIQQAESERKILRLRRLLWGLLAILLLTLLAEAIVIFRPMIRRVSTYVHELMQLAATDPLTGAANRRSFMERAAAEAARARRHDHAAAVLLVDIDRFKAINDTYGHAAGDAVLKALCGLLGQTLRAADIWGRVGGEEFAALLVETELGGAAVVAERLRRRCDELRLRYRDHDLHFSVSIGVAALSEAGGGLEGALRQADRLLYVAKNNGRNCVATDSAALLTA